MLRRLSASFEWSSRLYRSLAWCNSDKKLVRISSHFSRQHDEKQQPQESAVPLAAAWLTLTALTAIH